MQYLQKALVFECKYTTYYRFMQIFLKKNDYNFIMRGYSIYYMGSKIGMFR